MGDDVSTSVISAEMRAAVGSELGRIVSFPISESDIRKWAIATYYPEEPPELFWDPAAAAAGRWGGIVAPEDFNPFAWMPAQPKGIPKTDGVGNPDTTENRLGLAGPGLTNQLNGGLEITYGVRMRPGDVITSVNRLAGYREKQGRLGLMLMTALETTWTNDRDEFVKSSTLTLIRY